MARGMRQQLCFTWAQYIHYAGKTHWCETLQQLHTPALPTALAYWEQKICTSVCFACEILLLKLAMKLASQNWHLFQGREALLSGGGGQVLFQLLVVEQSMMCGSLLVCE